MATSSGVYLLRIGKLGFCAACAPAANTASLVSDADGLLLQQDGDPLIKMTDESRNGSQKANGMAMEAMPEGHPGRSGAGREEAMAAGCSGSGSVVVVLAVASCTSPAVVGLVSHRRQLTRLHSRRCANNLDGHGACELPFFTWLLRCRVCPTTWRS